MSNKEPKTKRRAKLGGRPTKYTKQLEKKAYEYIEMFDKYGDSIPSVVGMCAALGVRRSTLYEWAKDEEKKFSDILAACKEIQEMHLLNGGINGSMNSNIVKLVLGKHGYSDKQEITDPHGESILLSDTEREAKLAALIAKLEKRKESDKND